jgi:hypothetical protein
VRTASSCLFAWLFLPGCTLFLNPGGGGVPEGQRLVTGELLNPREGDFGGVDNFGMALAALVGDPGADPADPADDTTALVVGVPFNPSQTGAAGGDRVRFNLLLPSDRGAVLFFQTTPLAGSGSSPGVFLAGLSFASDLGGAAFTAYLPPGEQTIDLGLVRILAFDATINTDNLAAPEDNPLDASDTDGDGTSDLADGDDDGDNVPDAEDSDADGDGVEDVAVLAAFDALIGLTP